MRARQPKGVKPVRLELENERVWQGERGLRLTPKAFSVLRCLLEHAGRLVTKEALLKSAWPNRVVSDDALSTCIREIRKVLGDAAGAPQYLETVHRRGYRFIGPLANIIPTPGPRPMRLVGRAGELERLRSSLAKASLTDYKSHLSVPMSRDIFDVDVDKEYEIGMDLEALRYEKLCREHGTYVDMKTLAFAIHHVLQDDTEVLVAELSACMTGNRK